MNGMGKKGKDEKMWQRNEMQIVLNETFTR